MRGRRGWWVWAVLAAAVLAIVFVRGRPPSDGPPLDPSSTGPLGTKALVLLLRELGGRVEVTGAASADFDTAILLRDNLDDEQRRDLREWVDAGGVLVVADPSSDLTLSAPAADPLGGESFSAEGRIRRGCDLPALRQVSRVNPSGGVLFRVPPGATGCFRRGGNAFVVLSAQRRGTVVAIGGAGPFVNANLDNDDHAALIASLLAPRPGTEVALLRPPLPGGGEQGLWDLVSRGVKLALWQLVAAFVFLALWRARRLGRPVLEPQPVELAASSLVAAVGNLFHHARSRGQAAALLRADLRRDLAQRLGLPASAPADYVAEVAAARSGTDYDRLVAALEDGPVADDEALVGLAALVEDVRQEVVHA